MEGGGVLGLGNGQMRRMKVMARNSSPLLTGTA